MVIHADKIKGTAADKESAEWKELEKLIDAALEARGTWHGNWNISSAVRARIFAEYQNAGWVVEQDQVDDYGTREPGYNHIVVRLGKLG